MPKYMFIFRGGAPEIPDLSPTEMEAHLRKWYAWAGELAKAGRHTGGQPLEGMGKTIRGRNRTVTDGPYAESKDLVTGSLVIEASSLEEATELAMDCPVFEFGGSVEVMRLVVMQSQVVQGATANSRQNPNSGDPSRNASALLRKACMWGVCM